MAEVLPEIGVGVVWPVGHERLEIKLYCKIRY
jgi:hypothetical protein